MPAEVCATCFYSMPLGYDLDDERYTHPLVCRKATTHPEERFPLIWPIVEATFSCENYVPKENVAMFIDRGDAADEDFEKPDLSTDGAWHDMDLSGIVDTDAKSVLLAVYFRATTVARYFQFRTNGNTHIYSRSILYNTVANIYATGDLIVPLDADGKIEYNASNITFYAYGITVKGWWF